MVVVQRLGRHIGLERLIRVGKGREFEGHGCAPALRWCGQKRGGS
jgi:hypothetical protein